MGTSLDCASSWQALVDELYALRRFGIKPGLRRMQQSLQAEGNPHRSYDVITVAGTNGKGTVASSVAAILQSHGRRVGLYTSPHLLDVRERFRVDGMPLDRESVEPLLRRLLSEYAAGDHKSGARLTFFEMTTLAAACLFGSTDVDCAVMEVGLGGRLDAVNAMDPTVSVVTPVGRDHTRYLGDQIWQIAGEKAGIFRPGVPAVIGHQEEAEAHEALLKCARQTGAIPRVVEGVEELSVTERHWATARCGAQIYLDVAWNESHFDRARRCWRWPGRFHQLNLDEEGRLLWIDAAHNQPGVEALRDWLTRCERPPCGAIWGGMRDKEADSVQALLDWLDCPVWGSIVDNRRGRTEEELRRHVPQRLWRGAAATGECLRDARRATRGDLLAFGSVFLVGEVYEWLGVEVDSLCTYADD